MWLSRLHRADVGGGPVGGAGGGRGEEEVLVCGGEDLEV